MGRSLWRLQKWLGEIGSFERCRFGGRKWLCKGNGVAPCPHFPSSAIPWGKARVWRAATGGGG